MSSPDLRAAQSRIQGITQNLDWVKEKRERNRNTPELREKQRVRMTGLGNPMKDPAVASECSRAMLKRWKDPTDQMFDHPVASRFVHGWYVSKKTGAKEFFQSGYELQRFKQLDSDSEVKFWTKRHGLVILYNHEGGRSSYHPDLLVWTQSGWVLEEVKGWVTSVDLLKFEAARLFCFEYSGKITFRVLGEESFQ